MSQKTLSRKEIVASLIAKAQAEPRFRQELLRDAKVAIEKELGITLPAGIDLRVVEETATMNYIVLPVSDSSELLDADLDAVAGGVARRIDGGKGKDPIGNLSKTKL